ncbi:MAG: hypothetical protein AAB303_02410, partial [Chloroflexota bacterium]
MSEDSGVVSKVRKAQGTEVPSGGLGVSPRFNTPPLRHGEGDTGGEVKDYWDKAEDSGTGVILEKRSEVAPPPEAGMRQDSGEARWNRWEVLVFVLIVLLAFGLRMWDLGARALHHDESLHALYGWYIFDGREYRHDPMMHGPFQFFGYASVFWLLWDSDFTVRLLPA